jgi:glycosyltransferase involved in cell wall biosynthesis
MSEKDNLKTALIVCGEFPYPPVHGGKVDVMMILNEFSPFFDKVDLLVVDKEEPCQERVAALTDITNGDVFFIKRRECLLDLFSLLPYQIASRKQLKYFNPGKEYSFMLVSQDYSYLALKNKNIVENVGKVALRNHNNEANYFNRLSKISGISFLKRVYYWTESIKFKLYYRFFLNKNTMTWFISKDEYDSFDLPNKKWLPPALNTNSFIARDHSLEENNYKVCFVGSLFMDNNIEGLKWYLDEVHPEIIKMMPNYKLTIAGNPKDRDVAWLSSYKNFELHIAPSDEELNDIYKNSQVFISPMLNGAGVKLKAVNAIVFGLPVVGTSIGCEGVGFTNGEQAFVTDQSEVFVKSLVSLLENNKLREAMLNEAQSYLKEYFVADYLELIKDV